MDVNTQDTVARLRPAEGELELQLEIARQSMELARFALKGTMIGGLAGLLLIFGLAIIAASSEVVQIRGKHLCGIVIALYVVVAAYGSFIFNRSARIAASWGGGKIAITTADQCDSDRGRALSQVQVAPSEWGTSDNTGVNQQ